MTVISKARTSGEVTIEAFAILQYICKANNAGITHTLAENEFAMRKFIKCQGLEMLTKMCNQFDIKDVKSAAATSVKLALRLINSLVKKDVEIAHALIELGLVTFLSPVLMSTGGGRKQSQKEVIQDFILLVCQLYSELTETRDLQTLTIMADDTGLISSLVSLLKETKDDDCLVCILKILTNLGSLQQVQENMYLVKNGLPQIVKLIQLQGKVKLVVLLSSIKLLRQLCASKDLELKQALRKLEVIKVLLMTLHKESEEHSELSFYCKLSLLDLCSSPEDLLEIEANEGVDHLISLALYEPKNLEEKLLFSKTILIFTKRSSLIQFDDVFPFFTRTILKYLALTYRKTQEASKKTAKQIKMYASIQKSSVKALRNISLKSSSHREIFCNEGLRIIFLYLQDIASTIEDLKEDRIHGGSTIEGSSKQDQILCVLQAVTNCLLNEDVKQYLAVYQDFDSIDPTLIEKLLHLLHTYHGIKDDQPELKAATLYNKALKSFIKNLQRECTLALLMIESTYQRDLVSSASNENKVQFLIKILSIDDVHSICKSLSVIGSLANQQWATSEYLYSCKIVQIVKSLIETNKDPSITRESANLVAKLLEKPDNLWIWLKFDSSNAAMNSASVDEILTFCKGEPKRLPKDRGMYRNWGAFFGEGDLIVLSNEGLSIQSKQLLVSVWLVLPIIRFSNHARRHVLVHSQKGPLLMIDETGSRLGSIDEDSGLFLDSGYDLTTYKKGWHHLAAQYDQDSVTFYIDGVPTTKESKVLSHSFEIWCIGNSPSGQDPFGTICDFRIYERLFTNSQIKSMSKYNDSTEYEMPDKHCLSYLAHGIIDILVGRLKADIDSTVTSIFRVLSKLATKRECRSKILSLGGLNMALELMTKKSQKDGHDSSYVKEAQILIFNLQ